MPTEIVTLALELDIENLEQRLNEVENELVELGNKGDRSTRRVGGSFQRLGRSALALSRQLKAAFAIFLGGVLAKQAAATAREIELNFSRIEGLVGVAVNEIQEFKDELGAIAGETGKTGAELSRALFTITSAGARGANALEVLELSAKAASAGLGDTEVVAKALLGAVQSYGEENLSAAQSLDILVATVRAGNLSADQLAVTLGKVTGVAAELGVEFSDLGGFIANISLTGLSSAESVSRLSGVLRFLQRQTPDVRKRLEELGTSGEELRAIAGSGPGGLVRVFRFLRERLEATGQGFEDIIPEVEALQGVLSLVGKNVTSTDRVFNTVTNSAGSAEQAFGAWAKTLDGAVNRANAEFQRAIQDIAKITIPSLTGALNLAADALGGLQRLARGEFIEREALDQINEDLSTTIQQLIAARQRVKQLTPLRGEGGILDFFQSAREEAKALVDSLEKERARLLKAQFELINREQLRKQRLEFEKFLNEVQTKLEEAQPKAQNTFQQFFGGPSFAFGTLIFDEAKKAAQGAQLVETEAERLIASLKRERDLYGDVTKEQEIRYRLEQEGIEGLTPERERLIRSIAKEITERDKLKKAQEENIRKNKLLTQAIGEFETDELERQLDREERARELLQMTFSEQNKEALEAAKQIEEFNQLAKQVDFISDEDVRRFSDFVNSQLSFMKDNAEETFSQIDEFTRAAFESMQNTASDLFFGVMQGEFDDLAGNFKKTLDRMVADLLASQLLNAAITRGGGNVQQGGAGFSFGTFLSSFGIGQGARGAFAQKNQPFLIGERGPELFVPQTAGNIVPLKGPAEVNARGGPSDDMFNTGTQSVMVNMTIQTPDAASFQRSQSQIAANAAQQFNAALRRNG